MRRSAHDPIRTPVGHALRALALVLVLGASGAGEELPAPDVIAAVMRGREAATYPVAIRYSAEHRWGQRVSWLLSYAGECVWERDRRLHRDQHYTGSGKADPYDRTTLFKRDTIDLRDQKHVLSLVRRPDSSDDTWGGSIAPINATRARLSPGDFGLRFAARDASNFLEVPSARVVGRERVGEFSCVTVLFDRFDKTSSSIRNPALFALSESHGYFPVRFVAYNRTSDDSRYPSDDALELDGRQHPVIEERVVHELARAGGGWIPVACSRRMASRQQAPGHLELRAASDSIRTGASLREEFLLKDVHGALVRNGVQGGTMVLGGSPYQVSGGELSAIVTQLTSMEGVPAEDRTQPEAGIARHLWVLVPLAGFLLSYLGFRWWRRAASSNGAA
jgi:hypothetical protein